MKQEKLPIDFKPKTMKTTNDSQTTIQNTTQNATQNTPFDNPFLLKTPLPTNVEITDEDREKFLKAMLGLTSYTETYQIKNILTFGFKTLLISEQKAIAYYLQNQFSSKALEPIQLVFMLHYSLATLALSITHINNQNFVESKDNPYKALEENIKILQQLPSFVYSIIEQKYSEFTSKIMKLTEEFSKGDFLLKKDGNS